ncbi:Gfo/Idh/MocA family protein [Siminovitchia sediminis]|uniref:Gfo/Idh/MocA family protein n=1 Tax=Siminovitchia sediminis TaxID=1274353 RepID=A0ABW4KI62_9BACI
MIRAGLIGCGYISHKHVRTLSRMTEISLIAVCDIQPGKMKETAALYQSEKSSENEITLYKNYVDLLKDSRIDLVINCTSSGFHYPMTKEALRYGKHVIVEKPLTLSLREADDLIHTADLRKKHIFVCHQLRFRPLMQRIKELLDQGVLGETYMGTVSLRLHRSLDYYTSSNWKGTWEHDGGMLVNQGVHLIDLLIWYLGDVQSVYGEMVSRAHEKETEDAACGILSFQNKAMGLIEANTITKPKNQGYQLSIFGEKGTIHIGGPGFNEVLHCYIEGLPTVEEELRRLSIQLDEHERMYQSFLKTITQQKENDMSAKEGRRALETIFALYKSSKKKGPVSLPMGDFSTKDMLET